MKNVFCCPLLVLLFAACSKKDNSILALLQSEKNNSVIAASNIENLYTANGTETVAATIITDNSGRKLYKIYYPSSLNGIYPLITWGNGTAALPKNYDSLLIHLASRGFIVIDNYSMQTGSGKEILNAANYMLAQNNTKGSMFYHAIDTAHVGAAGHSQGATGVINAHTRYASGKKNIKVLATVALPSLSLSSDNDKYDVTKIICPVFFISGTNDGLISPLSTNKTAYNNLKNGLPATIGLRVGAGHNAIQTNTSEWGYLTAWMMYELKNDSIAKKAFALPNAEILNNNDWKNAAVKNIY